MQQQEAPGTGEGLWQALQHGAGECKEDVDWGHSKRQGKKKFKPV